MIAKETRAKLRRLHGRATMAGWVVEEHIDGILTIETGGVALWKRVNVAQLSCDGAERLRAETNAKLICLMRNSIGPLLDALAAAEAERDGLRAEIGKVVGWIDDLQDGGGIEHALAVKADCLVALAASQGEPG